MTSDEPAAEPPSAQGRSGPGADIPFMVGWLARENGAGKLSVLDQRFDAASLSVLRVSARACAARAGMPAGRVTDIVIALHEVAANAVRHGAGSGRLRMWDHLGALYCLVDDDGPAAAGAGVADSAGQNLADRWPYEPGHGLWVARQVADQMAIRSDASGTRVIIIFTLPAIPESLGAATGRPGLPPSAMKPYSLPGAWRLIVIPGGRHGRVHRPGPRITRTNGRRRCGGS
jgi:anti-sigma regulatory factor (Ser/Thr protein kinase)